MTEYNLPTLYSIDKSGKERMWRIWVVNNAVFKEYGTVSGKKIITEPRVFEAKNIGKKNATTSEEQAMREAERDWIKQLDKAYFPSDDDTEGKNMMERVMNEKKKTGNVNTGLSTVVRNEPIKASTSKTLINATFIEIDDDNYKLLPNYKIEGYETDFKPMHADVWDDIPKVRKYINFEKGIYVQPKLNGIRAHISFVGGYVVLTTRQGKQFGHFKHLREASIPIFQKFPDVILDVELYAHKIFAKQVYSGKPDPNGKRKVEYLPLSKGEDNELVFEAAFGAITSICNVSRTKASPLEDQIQAWVFDIADPTGKLNQDQRFKIRDDIFNYLNIKNDDQTHTFVKVPTRLVYSLKEVDDLHDHYARDNFEGVVLRSRDMLYENGKRSKSMRKYKYFEDKEFEIIGVEYDPGVARENFSWVCKTDEGRIFKAKPTGSVEQRREWFDNSDSLVGKMLTVRYKDKSFVSGEVPREPRGIAIRDYE